MAAASITYPPGISQKPTQGLIRGIFQIKAELLSFNLNYVANLTYVGKSLQAPMTDRSAPQYANAPPSEQPSCHKKVKRPTMPTLGHTVCLGVIGSAETALCGGQKGVPAAREIDQHVKFWRTHLGFSRRLTWA